METGSRYTSNVEFYDSFRYTKTMLDMGRTLFNDVSPIVKYPLAFILFFPIFSMDLLVSMGELPAKLVLKNRTVMRVLIIEEELEVEQPFYNSDSLSIYINLIMNLLSGLSEIKEVGGIVLVAVSCVNIIIVSIYYCTYSFPNHGTVTVMRENVGFNSVILFTTLYAFCFAGLIQFDMLSVVIISGLLLNFLEIVRNNAKMILIISKIIEESRISSGVSSNVV